MSTSMRYAILISLLAVPALAQSPATPVVVVAPAPAPVVVAPVAPVAPIVAVTPVAPPRHDSVRVRFALGVSGGGFFGDIAGGMGGMHAALGVQFDQYFGLYLQTMGMGGGFVVGGQDFVAAAFLYNSILFDVTLGHLFQVGAGPALDFVVGCGAGASGLGCGNVGPFFGLDARVALAIGGHDVGPRGGFVVAADLHPTFVPGGVSMALILSLGGQIY